MDPHTTLAPDSGLSAWFKARARLRRARVLYACGQVIASRGEPAGAQRSARLYRRALELLFSPSGSSAEPKTPDRVTAREQLRAELRRRSLRGWLRTSSRRVQLVVGLGVLVLLAGATLSWIEPDLAEGKLWQASTAWGAFPGIGVMRGEAPIDGRFHTIEEDNPWVRVDLGAVQRVHAVRVENRTNCCRERALPLAIELSSDGKSWTLVGYRRLLFDTFTQQFASRDARYVRLRVDRRSLLHLRRVSVY